MTLDAKLKSKLFKNSPVSDKEIDEIISEKRVPTVSPSINWALEGGIVPGRFYCFVGPESAGKSMFAVSCCVEMLKNNPNGRIIGLIQKNLSLRIGWIFL